MHSGETHDTFKQMWHVHQIVMWHVQIVQKMCTPGLKLENYGYL